MTRKNPGKKLQLPPSPRAGTCANVQISTGRVLIEMSSINQTRPQTFHIATYEMVYRSCLFLIFKDLIKSKLVRRTR